MKIVLSKGAFFGPVSGADESVVTYAIQLKMAGHSPSVVLMHQPGENDPYYERLQRAGVPVTGIIPASVSASWDAGRRILARVYRTFPASKRMLRPRVRRISSGMAARYFGPCREYFMRCDAEIVHVVTPDPNAMLMIRAAHAAGLPILYQELGRPFHPPGFEAHYQDFTSVLPLCAGVAALSPRLAQECQEKLPKPCTLSVLPIIVESAADGYVRTPGLPDRVRFGFAARFEHLKGPETFLQAFALVRRRMRGASVTLAGSGSLTRQLARQVSSAGLADCCRFYGTYYGPRERSTFLQGVDVFVLPSVTEGTPNSIVEAMAHGVPIIASAVGGVPDMVTPEVGILVPPGDPVALAEAMTALASDPARRERMGRAALDTYQKLFAPGVVLPLVIDTYRRVAARHDEACEVPNPHPWQAAALELQQLFA